jgi:hypothetical protein
MSYMYGSYENGWIMASYKVRSFFSSLVLESIFLDSGFWKCCIKIILKKKIDSRDFSIKCPDLKCKLPILDTDLQETLDDF